MRFPHCVRDGPVRVAQDAAILLDSRQQWTAAVGPWIDHLRLRQALSMLLEPFDPEEL